MDYDDQPNYKLFRRWGDVWMPRVEVPEPLKVEIAHFLECVRTGAEPVAGVTHARDTVAVLEAVEISLQSAGSAVEVRREVAA
jgi:predicted dehydrogenase